MQRKNLMLKLKYAGGRDGVSFRVDGHTVTVAPGETVEVSDETIASQLLSGAFKPGDKATTSWWKNQREEAAPAAEGEVPDGDS